MHSASEIARWFLVSQDETTGERISNLKLQKLCYYAQALHLAVHGEPLFREPVRAWKHGPVVPSLWREYRGNAYYSIPIPEDIDESDLSETAQGVLSTVRDTYGMQSATTLRDMTHEERPWRDAWERNGAVIKQGVMGAYFKRHILPILQIEGRPRPLEKQKVAEILQNDEALAQRTAIGLEDIQAGRSHSLA